MGTQTCPVLEPIPTRGYRQPSLPDGEVSDLLSYIRGLIASYGQSHAHQVFALFWPLPWSVHMTGFLFGIPFHSLGALLLHLAQPTHMLREWLGLLSVDLGAGWEYEWIDYCWFCYSYLTSSTTCRIHCWTLSALYSPWYVVHSQWVPEWIQTHAHTPGFLNPFTGKTL